MSLFICMKKFFVIIFVLLVLVGSGLFVYYYLMPKLAAYQVDKAEKALEEAQDQATQGVIEARRQAQTKQTEEVNPFDKDGKVHVLLLGLDKRVGQASGHCDVIQMINIDKTKETVNIMALPRGTYSPLPPGKGTTSTDYYVSNACGLGGLDYGIKQIEKILGQKADYIVVVGFSETLGILRTLNLPTTETLQWLRTRHVYAIGEPQRAHNHSTFLKQVMTKYIPKEKTKLDTPLQYIVYKIVQTDLTFDEAVVIGDALRAMDLEHNPDKITLSMRPSHPVQDIPYDPEHLNIKPGVDTQESIQKKLFDTIAQKKNDKEFIMWAFDNDLWLQVDDAQKRESTHFEFLEKYLKFIENAEKRKELIADYILEMEHRELPIWQEKGKQLLKKEVEA